MQTLLLHKRKASDHANPIIAQKRPREHANLIIAQKKACDRANPIIAQKRAHEHANLITYYKGRRDEMKLSIHPSRHPFLRPFIHPFTLNGDCPRRTVEFFLQSFPKSRPATWTHCLNLANSSFFSLKNMANVLEVLFCKFLPKVALGFFLSPVGEISPKKKKKVAVLKLGILAIAPTKGI